MRGGRSVISYEDLPHDARALQNVAVESVNSTPEPKKRRRVEKDKRYRGLHWDEPDSSATKASPGWSAMPIPQQYDHDQDQDQDQDSDSQPIFDSDEAIIASPTNEEPFLEEIELPSGNPLDSKEIWDDRFLLDTWRAAEEEYKEFHQRRSEHIDQLQAKNKDVRWYSLPDFTLQTPSNDGHNELGDGDIYAANDPLSGNTGQPQQQSEKTDTYNRTEAEERQTNPTPVSLPSLELPNGMPASETLQNLMMAWYYTGYYSALHQQEQSSQSSL
ncbi:hypothetical protein MYAM1_000521 [Malassezia yamatoensis]|uniref:Survival motor neuron Tudor domain-containing protein n=1 Tax=Malassezia yamatoensis TaxID=253288 RepID=A0AAJ5YPM8_9BASI|nr:hypothetical protein MYAM1_000521 [Malassezia yamatoensis]